MIATLLNVQTDPELLAALHNAAGQPMSHKDIMRQRISFVASGSSLPRTEVHCRVLAHEGLPLDYLD